MALPGKNVRVNFGTGTTSSAVITQINDATITINGQIIDITSFEDTQWRVRLANLQDANVTLSGWYAPSDTNGQVALRTALFNGTSTASTVTILADQAVPTSGFTGTYFVESFEVGASVEDAVTVSISLLSTGAITVSA